MYNWHLHKIKENTNGKELSKNARHRLNDWIPKKRNKDFTLLWLCQTSGLNSFRVNTNEFSKYFCLHVMKGYYMWWRVLPFLAGCAPPSFPSYALLIRILYIKSSRDYSEMWLIFKILMTIQEKLYISHNLLTLITQVCRTKYKNERNFVLCISMYIYTHTCTCVCISVN